MKMKRKKIIKIIGIVAICFYFTNCVNDNDFEIPASLGNEENTKLTNLLDSIQAGIYQLKTIKEVKELYISGNEPLKVASKIVVKGYVISSDQKGNYFREFYMQDALENPTAGLKVSLNLSNNYNKFNFGREVYISLKIQAMELLPLAEK